MKKITVSRRQVLQGAGGFTIGLPLLPSLFPVKAYAADVVLASQPRFVALTGMHGGVFDKDIFPDEATANETLEVHPGHVARRGPLRLSSGKLSPVLSSSHLSERLVAKLNVLRGLDIPFGIAHHTGGILGNFASNDGNETDGRVAQNFPMPTIDQVMAWSPNFYKSLAGIKERFMVTHSIHRSVSWSFANPSTKTGPLQGIRNVSDPRELFNKIFVPGGGTTAPPAVARRTPIINRVIENYRRLAQGNRRLSLEDKQRLDAHVARLDELDRRLNTTVGNGGNLAVCKDQVAPSNASGAIASHVAFNDVFVAAFMCGTSRIAVKGNYEADFVTISGNWHQDFAHQYSAASAQPKLQEARQKVFHNGFADLVRKMDVEEAPGQTVLDNSLVSGQTSAARKLTSRSACQYLQQGRREGS